MAIWWAMSKTMAVTPITPSLGCTQQTLPSHFTVTEEQTSLVCAVFIKQSLEVQSLHVPVQATSLLNYAFMQLQNQECMSLCMGANANPFY